MDIASALRKVAEDVRSDPSEFSSKLGRVLERLAALTEDTSPEFAPGPAPVTITTRDYRHYA
jgi:hypothetical protein